MTLYATQSGALANAMTFSAPTNNSSVYTLPNIQNLNWVRLYHNSVDGTTPYRIYQFMPRTLIQVDDLEADVIDAVTLRVSGSIVVSADDLAPGSITGDKIMAGTVSGVLITPGTITANQIAVSGITANRLNVTQLDAVAANMGTLVVNSGISIGANGTIWAGTGTVDLPQTGLKIYTTSGVSRLTTYNSSTPQIDIGSDGKLKAGMGNVVLDSTGISIGTIDTPQTLSEALRIYGSGGDGNIVGMAFYNGSYSAVNPQITIQADSTNALEIENNAVNGITNFNFPASGLNNSAAVNIYNANLELKRTPIPFEDNITPGALIGYDSDGTMRYKLGHDQLVLNNNTNNTFVVNASNGSVTSSSSINANSVQTVGNLTAGTGALKCEIDGATGNVTSDGNIFALNTITAFAGFNSSYLGSDYAFKVDTGGKLTTQAMGYLTVRRTGTLAITTAGTTIVWQSVTRSRNITVPTPTDTITIDNAGYYMFSATFATVANLTSLRMTLQRGTITYVSTLHDAGLNTGGGYIFNFNVGFWSSAGATYKVILTPSANTTLNANNEGFAGPSPIMNIFQAIGV
jgi:hypothetical protein